MNFRSVDLESELAQVSFVFPDVDKNAILQDLSLTANAEETINRILDGRVTATSSNSGKETDGLTDVNSDSDLDLPTITRKKTCSYKEQLSDHLNLNRSYLNNGLRKSDSLSSTDINSDELPDIDASSFTDYVGFTENNDIIDHTHNQIVQKSSEMVEMETVNLSAANSNTNRGCKFKFSKKTIPADSSVPVEISDSSNDSFSSVSEKLDCLTSLSERCRVKTNNLNKILDGGRMHTSDNNILDDGKTRTSNVTSSDAIEVVNNCEMLPDLERISDAETFIDDDYVAVNFHDIKKKIGVKRRTPQEIEESRKLAKVTKAVRQQERDNKKAMKEREKQQKKAEQESKKHFKAGDCVKFMTVCVDPGIINNNTIAAPLFKICADLGAQCLTESQLIPNSITWRREVIDCSQLESRKKHVTEDNVLTMIPVDDFVQMVHLHALQQHGNACSEGLTVREYIQSVQSCHAGKDITVFVLGMERYFSDQKLTAKRQHRDAVSVTGGSGVTKSKKQKANNHDVPMVSRIELEEALVDAQLYTHCIVKLLDMGADVADLVRTFTKAVADKPVKKDRLDNPFNFLEEGVAGVKVDKTGCGLLKVWKHQLLQFQHVGPDMAEAIVAAYPSPRMLIEAYRHCLQEKDAQRLLENIVVRRGAGVLVTNRRIGKELSKRIHSFITSTDPLFVIK